MTATPPPHRPTAHCPTSMHAITRKPYQSVVFGLNGLLVAAGWAAYLVLGWYELFKVGASILKAS